MARHKNVVAMPGKIKALILLAMAEIFGMALWFTTSAVMVDMVDGEQVSAFRQGLLATSVQAGFAIGAVVYAVLGLADRFDPRRVFAFSAWGAAILNASLLFLPVAGVLAILARALTGALLAGVYPVGMKIAVGWGQKDRGLIVGILVGALTIGSASPHLLAFWGGADWRIAIAGASVIAFFAGIVILGAKLGPFHAKAPAFNPSSLKLAWTDRRIRLAYAGYLGHMWELYALWAWVGVAMVASFEAFMPSHDALSLSKLVAFFVVAAGAISSGVTGLIADKVGKTKTTMWVMVISAGTALAAAALFSSLPAVLISVMILWGIFVIADSAQFSAMVADYAPADQAGTLLTFQTALGFALTIFTVQATPFVAQWIGWPGVFVTLALGPIFGVIALRRLGEADKSEVNLSSAG